VKKGLAVFLTVKYSGVVDKKCWITKLQFFQPTAANFRQRVLRVHKITIFAFEFLQNGTYSAQIFLKESFQQVKI